MESMMEIIGWLIELTVLVDESFMLMVFFLSLEKLFIIENFLKLFCCDDLKNLDIFLMIQMLLLKTMQFCIF